MVHGGASAEDGAASVLLVDSDSHGTDFSTLNTKENCVCLCVYVRVGVGLML